MAATAELVSTTRNGSSKTAIRILGVVLALSVVALGLIWARLGDARERTGDLERRLTATNARVDQIESSLVAAEERLQKTEGTVAAREAQATGRSNERASLATTPSKFIQSLEVTSATRGILRTYSHAVSTKLRNGSHFNVSGLRGIVEYRGADGSLVGSSPVQVEGTLLAGQTAVLSLSAGEITGGIDSTKSKIILNSLTILGGE